MYAKVHVLRLWSSINIYTSIYLLFLVRKQYTCLYAYIVIYMLHEQNFVPPGRPTLISVGEGEKM